MAVTDFGQLSDARRVAWALELWKAGRDRSFWFSNGFMGSSDSDMTSVVQRVSKLSDTERGKECVMQLVQDLQGDGVAGDNLLEGNEEALFNDTQVITIDQLRNGTKNKGRMAEQATVIRFRQTAKEKLAFWMGDKIDELMFLTGSGRSYSLRLDGRTRTGSTLPSLKFAASVVAPSPNRILYAGSATSEATLTASDKMSWATLVRAKTMAVRKRLNPIRSGGKEYFAVVMSAEQARDLVLDPTYQTIVSRVGEKGASNPLMKGALATVQGLILFEHNKVFNTLGLAAGSRWGAGGNVHGAQALLLGAQAMGAAFMGQTPSYEESSSTDYKNRPGVSVGRIMGFLKPQYKSIYDENTRQDFSTIAVKTAAAA